jgi:glutamyl-tRNA synthetase
MAPPVLRSRFAPTPSGYLHLGNVFSFLLTWLLVRRESGEVLLRIDDIDAERKRPEYVQDIFETLNWLNLSYDIGPANAADFEANWSQHHRIPLYEKALHQLSESPGLLFACTCSRAQLAQTGSAAYPGTCVSKHLPLDTPDAALRLFVDRKTKVTVKSGIGNDVVYPLGKNTGSFVVRRRNGLPAYQLASLCDDLHFDINAVVRGEDLTGSTAQQIYQAQCLEEPAFAKSIFVHHPLLKDEHGSKLSKSEGALAVRSLRANGHSPGFVYSWFARVTKLTTTPVSTIDELLHAFDGYPLSKLQRISDLR